MTGHGNGSSGSACSSGRVVIHERAVDGTVHHLQHPRGAKAVTATRAVTETEAADYCEPETERRHRTGDAG